MLRSLPRLVWQDSHVMFLRYQNGDSAWCAVYILQPSGANLMNTNIFLPSHSTKTFRSIMPRFLNLAVLTWSLIARVARGDSALYNASACDASTFSFPDILGAKLFDLTAHVVRNYTATSLLPGTDIAESYTIDFCNVTVTYSHTGWNDTINASIWVPLQHWNQRMLGLGGGGFSASFGSLYQTAAVSKGFVAVATDSGHEAGQEASIDLGFWMTQSPGNLNLNLIENWASRTLGELSIIGKKAAHEFFGITPLYSYFTGCSGGGRQGLELAQTFPTAFDGILASSPAVYMETFLVSGYYPTLLMGKLDAYPPPCEINAFTEAAVNHCDRLDGLADGIISNSADCNFDPYSIVGKTFTCNTTESVFTQSGAKVVEAAWSGPQGDEASWPGVSFDADLTTSAVITRCDEGSSNCSSSSEESLFGVTIKNLILADPKHDLQSSTVDDFYRTLAFAAAKFRQWIGAANPQLSQFQQAGGKLITWHGGADPVIPIRGSSHYYDQVLKRNDNVSEFFRHFEAPGVGHCIGGAGPMPNLALEQLMSWVENGTSPATLDAYSLTTGLQRPLCPYPSQQVYIEGNSSDTGSFTCVSSA
ncbi:hypothetical protein Q7P37_006691 [Cladosporium fusiforme]